MTELPAKLANHLLQTVPAGLALSGEDGLLLWVTASFAQLVGFEPSECVGKSLAELDSSGRWSTRATSHSLHSDGPQAYLLVLPVRGANAAVPRVGVLSREAAVQRLEIEMSRSRRYDNPLSCLLVTQPVTIEPIAAALLVRFLREQLRWVDVIAQWSQTQLLVLLPETTARAATTLIRKLAPRAVAAVGGEVTFKWGASTWLRGDDAERLVERATPGAGGSQRALKLQGSQ